MIRSLLFTPANKQKLVQNAHKRDADVVLLDLEDSVPHGQKSDARNALPSALGHLRDKGHCVFVRVNSELDECIFDLQVSVCSSVDSIILPKVMGGDHLRLIDGYMSKLEQQAKLENRSVGLVALIETPEALLNIKEIAHSTPRLKALAFGSEDFSTFCGCAPVLQTMQNPSQAIIIAARDAKLNVYGLPGSIADIADIDTFETCARAGREFGFDGVMCIHPRQVEVVNRIYEPTADELAKAQKIVTAFDDAQDFGDGVVLVDGKMVDYPIVDRARRLLASTNSS